MTEQEIRSAFPALARFVYFNAAASGLMPEPVARAAAEVFESRCRGEARLFARNMARVERTREAVARLLGAAPEEIAFVANTAEGIGRVAAGLDWRPGDEIVLADVEYPANVYPWAAQRDRGVRLRFVRAEQGCVPAERLLEAIGPRTRVLAVSWVQFTSGYRVNLEVLGQFCRERGVLLVVDAIQGLGVFPLDVKRAGIGALAADGRKWLMAPEGSGVLYVAPDWAERIRPRVAGAMSVPEFADHLRYARYLDGEGQLDLEPLLRAGAGRFEAGLYDFAALAGLGAALGWIERVGREVIEARVRALVERFAEGIEARGWRLFGPRRPEERSGIVAFEIPGVEAERLEEPLRREGFVVAVRERRLRVSPHAYNTAAEVEAFFDALERLLQAGK